MARALRHEDHGVGDMGRQVVRTGDDAEAVALLPGIGHEALVVWPRELRLRLRRAVGQRRARGFVAVTIALVDLDQGFDFGIVVAPVGAHRGGAGVGDGDAAGAPHLFVEHLRVVVLNDSGAVVVADVRILDVARLLEEGHRHVAPLGVEDVAVPHGEVDRAFVAEECYVTLRSVEEIGQFLLQPPPVLEFAAVLVVADEPEVHRRGVDHVAVEVEHGAVRNAAQIE